MFSFFAQNPNTKPPPSQQKLYKEKFEKDKGKSKYNNMTLPPDVLHAMDVAKNQSNVSYAPTRQYIRGAIHLRHSFTAQKL